MHLYIRSCFCIFAVIYFSRELSVFRANLQEPVIFMLREKEEREKNLAIFQMLIKCNHRVYTWLYSEGGELLETDCPTILPHLLFRDAQALSHALENGVIRL